MDGSCPRATRARWRRSSRRCSPRRIGRAKWARVVASAWSRSSRSSAWPTATARSTGARSAPRRWCAIRSSGPRRAVLQASLLLYRRHFGALVLTCAVALVPANLLATGAVAFGLASLGVGGIAETRTHTQEVQQKQQELRERPPANVEAQDARARQLGREAFEGEASFDALGLLARLVPLASATPITAGLLRAGLFLAHAAAVPLVVELSGGRPSGPARAWAVAGRRIGPLLATGLRGALLVALGSLFLVVPGLLLAVGFSLAPAIVVLEGASGRAALERSWRQLHGHWSAAILMWALIAAFSLLASGIAALLPPGAARPLVSALVRVLLYPLPLAGLV